jgi:excisionase family DNA binding protein
MDTQAPSSTVSLPRFSYSLAETEIMTSLSRATLYRMIAAGTLKTVRTGGRRLVPTAELEKLCRPDLETRTPKSECRWLEGTQ